MDDAKTENPLHTMDDEELVSRMTLARDHGDNDLFRFYRKEVMYRLRRSHIETWTPPRRFDDQPTGGEIGYQTTGIIS